MMNCKRSLFLLVTLAALSVQAGSLNDIRQALEQSSVKQVQEKVYIHTDNSCYFVGDTLWYKAYVVRADNLQPTDMSRILHVELLSPDGLVVERQQVIVSPDGYTCGQFELKDSLYSGYYELRAYTRWMLNFNVRHHRYSIHDTWLFYNKQMAADYFRIWDGLYSRVFPVYSKPEQPGDYDSRRMYQRPKTRIPKVKKDDLVVTFYPEGGHLVEGVPNRVAFEVTDQFGAAVSIKGSLTADGMAAQEIATEYMGRGAFTVTPNGHRLRARFRFRDKDYTVSLPKSEDVGVAMQVDGNRLTLRAKGLPQDKEYGVSVICRGVLKHFEAVRWAAGYEATMQLPMGNLPLGVADVTLFDSDGRIWADRLTFNREERQSRGGSDWGAKRRGAEERGEKREESGEREGNASPRGGLEGVVIPVKANISRTRTYAPYEKIELPVECVGVTEPTTFSLSIRDTNTDEPTYDNGNIMTDLLLSSELKGFIASPAHYFESDDEQHRRDLDLLMMVQGWRKYKWEELADTAREMRYEPERTLTIEGAVYKMLSINEVEPDEVINWQNGVGMVARKAGNQDEDYVDPWAEQAEETLLSTADAPTTNDNSSLETMELGSLGNANDALGVNHSNLRHEVLVEAEVGRGAQFVGSVQKTKNGRFVFEVPPFYGDAYLNMKAYKENDSIQKNMLSRKDRKVLDEDAFPDFYVKRDLFFPMYTHDYTYYEKHQPDIDLDLMVDTLSELSMENDVHQLRNVNVRGHRRGRRAIDWKKPAYVVDAYDLYNDITDRGLSFGKVDMRQFPVQVCRYLFGNMNRYNSFRVDGRIDGATYYRNYSPVSTDASEAEQAGVFRANRTSQAVYRMLKLSRLQDIRVFTDFEPRTEDSTMVEDLYSADATVELVPIADDGRQVSFRDRHIIFHGLNEAEDFYQPDYSHRDVGSSPADYRRTLYWNPNAVTDEQGRFTATFYNNGKETRIKMTAAGVTGDGRLIYYSSFARPMP